MNKRLFHVLDGQAFVRVEMAARPFNWGSIEDLISHDTMRQLCALYPVTGFASTQSIAQSKCYRMYYRPWLCRGETHKTTDDLDPLWASLRADLTSTSYREALERLCNIDLSQSQLEITFWRYGVGCWLSPHTDKAGKILSHLFYFNEEWKSNYGGSLKILNSSDITDCAVELQPNAQESVVIVRCEHSWHAVTPVRASAHRMQRKSLQIVFWRA